MSEINLPEVTTSEYRADAKKLKGNLILVKKKPGRDDYVDRKFVVVEVDPRSTEAEAVMQAVLKLGEI